MIQINSSKEGTAEEMNEEEKAAPDGKSIKGGFDTNGKINDASIMDLEYNSINDENVKIRFGHTNAKEGSNLGDSYVYSRVNLLSPVNIQNQTFSDGKLRPFVVSEAFQSQNLETEESVPFSPTHKFQSNLRLSVKSLPKVSKSQVMLAKTSPKAKSGSTFQLN